jgi:cytochrome c oxidase subunit II
MNTFTQSVLDPHGPMAGRIHDLWLILFGVSVVVWVAVMLVLLLIFLRRKRESPASLQELGRSVAIAIGITAVTVLGILVASILTGGAIASVPANSLELSVVGHQWWWEIEYSGIPANRTVKTANEIHIPAGRPVRLKLSSRDVIHSFWIPNLRGKIDLIPSHINTTWIQADKPGVYRGQCAEFCGFQHAHMAVTLIAEDDSAYQQWYEGQLRQAAEPAQESHMRGRDIFMNSPCVVCHSIRGTEARGAVGPDLTHLASRTTLAAGTLPNTRGNLAGWVVDAQSTKPGSRMPPMSLQPQDLEPLLDYLGSLR